MKHLTDAELKEIEETYEDSRSDYDEIRWDRVGGRIPELVADLKVARELLKLAWENMQDDFDNKPGRHQMGRLSGRIKFFLKLGIHADKDTV